MKKQHRTPQAIFIVDPHREQIAVAEARRSEISIVAMVDTNCNPDVIDYPVPANDDAIRAIRLLTGKIADAVLEGIAQREAAAADRDAEAAAAEVDVDELEARSVGGLVFTPDDFAPGESAEIEPSPRTAARGTAPTETAGTTNGTAAPAESAAPEAPEAAPTAAAAPAATAPASADASDGATETPATTAPAAAQESAPAASS